MGAVDVGTGTKVLSLCTFVQLLPHFSTIDICLICILSHIILSGYLVELAQWGAILVGHPLLSLAPAGCSTREDEGGGGGAGQGHLGPWAQANEFQPHARPWPSPPTWSSTLPSASRIPSSPDPPHYCYRRIPGAFAHSLPCHFPNPPAIHALFCALSAPPLARSSSSPLPFSSVLEEIDRTVGVPPLAEAVAFLS